MWNYAPSQFDECEYGEWLAWKKVQRLELLDALDAIVRRLNRPPRSASRIKSNDHRYRRMCATCRKFIPRDKRSAYCSDCQSQRMIARRNDAKLARREAELRAMYEALDPAERREIEGQLYWSTIRDPIQHELTMAHRAKFGVTEEPLEYLFDLAKSPGNQQGNLLKNPR